MTYSALTPGEHPPGVHWTEGEVRDLDTDDVPAWLVAVVAQPSKPAPAAKPPVGKVEGG